MLRMSVLLPAADVLSPPGVSGFKSMRITEAAPTAFLHMVDPGQLHIAEFFRDIDLTIFSGSEGSFPSIPLA